MWQRPPQSLGTNSLLVQKTARLCVLTSASQGSVSPADRPSVCPISHDGWSARNHQMSSSSTAVLVVPPWQQPQPRLTDGPLKRQCTWFLFSICGFSVWRYCTFTNPMNTSIKAWSHQHPLHLVKQIWEVQDFPDHVFTFYERHLGRCPLDVCVCVCVSHRVLAYNQSVRWLFLLPAALGRRRRRLSWLRRRVCRHSGRARRRRIHKDLICHPKTDLLSLVHVEVVGPLVRLILPQPNLLGFITDTVAKDASTVTISYDRT